MLFSLALKRFFLFCFRRPRRKVPIMCDHSRPRCLGSYPPGRLLIHRWVILGFVLQEKLTYKVALKRDMLELTIYCLQLVFYCTYILFALLLVFFFFWHNHLCCSTRFLGEIVISEENVQVLLPASSILQMATVREACCKFLMRQLHPTNCLGIRSFAGKNNATKISEQHPFCLVNSKTILVFNYDFNFRYPCL